MVQQIELTVLFHGPAAQFSKFDSMSKNTKKAIAIFTCENAFGQ